MKTRVIAGLAAGILILGAIFFLSPLYVSLLVGAFLVIGAWECQQLLFEKPSLPRFLVMSIWGNLVLQLLHLHMDYVIPFCAVSFVVLALVEVTRAHRKNKPSEAIQHMMRTSFSVLYLVSIFGFITPIFNLPGHGREYLLLLVLIVFLGDTFAYFVGIRFGKRKLTALSPKKSVEGAVGAIVGSLLGVWIWENWIYTGALNAQLASGLLMVAPFFSIGAQMGDLFESVLKRSAEMKDSGSFLPGHGGILDRTDGLLITPVFYYYLQWVLS